MAVRRLVIAAIVALAGCQTPSPPATERVVIAGETFDLELAVDEQRGLLFAASKCGVSVIDLDVLGHPRSAPKRVQ